VRLSNHAWTEHALDVALDAADVAAGFPLGIDLEGRQPRLQLALHGSNRGLKYVGGRMRWIGGDEEDALALPAGGQRKGRRTGGLADAPLPAEKHNLLIDQRVQQHGRLPIGECSMPIRRCHW
jgi:hypothetical protein